MVPTACTYGTGLIAHQWYTKDRELKNSCCERQRHRSFSQYNVAIVTWDGDGKVWPFTGIVSQPMPTMGPTARVCGAGNDQRTFVEDGSQSTLDGMGDRGRGTHTTWYPDHTYRITS